MIIVLYSYAHKHDTRYIFEKVDRELIPIKGPLTELCIKKYQMQLHVRQLMDFCR